MKLATWNVNSIRTRLDHVLTWLQDNPVDALCLQETKVVDESFPRQAFAEVGYGVEVWGQKSYNGVAIASRHPLQNLQPGFAAVLGSESTDDLDEQKRILAAKLGPVQVVSVYVPNGSEIGSEKYAYKLRWLALFREYLATLLAREPLVCVGGDFNIALEDRDIHADRSDIASHIMASPAERAALRATLLDLGFQDAFRQFEGDGGYFSWWDYRAGSFARNRGWRIDHWYVSPQLAAHSRACHIDTAPRSLVKPSDHAPVVLDLSLDS